MHQSEYLQKIRKHLRTAYLLSDEKIDTVLPGFLQTLNVMMLNLEEAAGAGDNFESLNRAGHALKGALLNLGLSELADQAFLIEQYGKINHRELDYERIIAELKKTITGFS